MAQNEASKPMAKVRVPEGVYELVMWTDPIKSGAVFGATTVAYILLEHSSYTLLSILSYMLLSLVIALFVYSNLASFLNRPQLTMLSKENLKLSDDAVQASSEKIATTINKVLGMVERLASGQDVMLSLKVGGILYLAGKIGNAVRLLTLLYVAFLLAFTLPKAYRMYDKQLDEVLVLIKQHISKLVALVNDKVLSKIPKAKPVEKKEE